MRISNFIHIFDNEHIWNSLTKEKIKVNSKIIEYIKKYKNVNIELVPDYIKKENIVVDEKKEAKKIDDLILKTTDTQYQGLYLLAATCCNLDCDYCFYRNSISGTMKEKNIMSYEVAKKSVDKFYDITKNNILDSKYWQQVTIYGGEPLINKKMIKKIIPYIKGKFSNDYTDLVINTNLVLLDEELINIFKINKVIVQVSIDGTEKIHDLHRKTIDGEGSYKKVIENSKKLVNAGVEVIPMITATNDNVDSFSEIVKRILDEIGTNKFYTNVLISGTYEVKEKYFDILAAEMVKLYEEQDEYISADFYSLCDSIIGKDKIISKNSCGATRKITVFPNGDIYRCQAMQKLNINNIGNVDDDFDKLANNEIWKKRNRFNNSKCLSCEVVGSCGGGCATGSFNSTGSIYGIDNNQCQFTKSLYNQLKKRI